MLGDVADDCVVDPFGRAQGHGVGGGQVTSGGFVEQPLGQAAQGHPFAGQLPVQVDVLETQVLDGHAGVPEKFAGVYGGAFAVFDVLQCCNDAGFGCRCSINPENVHELSARPQRQVVPVVAVGHVNPANRAQFPQLVFPDADGAGVHGVVDVLFGKGSGLACGRKLALCFVLENLGRNEKVGGCH